MIHADFHVHSSYCDGKHTPKEIVEEAIARGMHAVGICTHAYTSFDTRYCIAKERVADFQKEIRDLQKAYQDRIAVYGGVEQDFFSDYPTDGFDYVIGSVHYLLHGGVYIPVDEGATILRDAADRYFGGDLYAICEAYYQTVQELPKKHRIDCIGHVDLITKYNRDGILFDETHSRYLAASRAAVDALLPYGIPFEINTGAIARGYQDKPYPMPDLGEYIACRGGKFILSGDSHRKENLCFAFETYADNPHVTPFLPKDKAKEV